MDSLKSEFLCDLTIDLLPGYQLGQGPAGSRIIGGCSGGSFTGPRLSGKVLPGGGDWLVMRPDGVMAIDARIILQADDGHILHVTYTGRIVIPPALMARVFNPEAVDAVDPAEYYFRATPTFEVATGSPHAWLNGKVAVAVGRLRNGGVAYRIHTIE